MNEKDRTYQQENIFRILNEIATKSSPRIGRSSHSAIPIALNTLKQNGLHPPLFSNKEFWVKQIVVSDKKAFMSLSSRIKLEFIVDGRLMNWRSNGEFLDYSKMNQSLHEGGVDAMSQFETTLLQVDLSFEYENFSSYLA